MTQVYKTLGSLQIFFKVTAVARFTTPNNVDPPGHIVRPRLQRFVVTTALEEHTLFLTIPAHARCPEP